jgi:hypothetical protein
MHFSFLVDVGTLVIESIKLTNLKKSMDSKKLNSTKATLSLNVDPKIEKQLNSKALIKEETGQTWGWSADNSYFPLLMRYKTALFIQLSQGLRDSHKSTARLWMKEIVDYNWQEVTLGLHDYTHEENEGNRDESSWGSDGPNGQIVLRLKFVPGFSPVHAQLPSFTADMLGADPFQKDDTWEKAHLLIQKETSDNYATNVPIKCTIDKDKRDQVLEHIDKSKQANKRRASSLIRLKKNKKPDVRQMSLATLTEKQRNELVRLLEEKQEQSETATNATAESTFNVFKPECYTNPTLDEASTAEDIQATNIAHKNQTASSDTSTTNFDVLKKDSISNSNKRSSSTVYGNSEKRKSSGYDFYNTADTRRISDTSTSSSVSSPITPAEGVDPTLTAHELMEIETATYLNALRDDLKNSKIHNYRVLRKLSKGKDYFSDQITNLRQGPNSEMRAKKAVKKEI